jgi:hypothetical protein
LSFRKLQPPGLDKAFCIPSHSLPSRIRGVLRIPSIGHTLLGRMFSVTRQPHFVPGVYVVCFPAGRIVINRCWNALNDIRPTLHCNCKVVVRDSPLTEVSRRDLIRHVSFCDDPKRIRLVCVTDTPPDLRQKPRRPRQVCARYPSVESGFLRVDRTLASREGCFRKH